VASPDVSVDPERYHSSPLYGVQPEKVHSFVLQPSGQVPRRTIRKVVAPQYRVGPANGLGIYNLGTVRCAIVPLAGHILGLFAWRCNTRYDGPNARGEPCPTLGPSFMQENSIISCVLGSQSICTLVVHAPAIRRLTPCPRLSVLAQCPTQSQRRVYLPQ
jgi:hypothetical protein